MNFKSISYAVTVSSESEEISKLIPHLFKYANPHDEIVIQIDSSSAHLLELSGIDIEAIVAQKLIEGGSPEINGSPKCKMIKFKFAKDFSALKNNLKKYCSKDYIFQIDADEIPNENLLKELPSILSQNPSIELLHVPRVNTVKGLNEHHLKRWNWIQNEEGWVQWPDYQPRILKNKSHIKWNLPVHETIINYQSSGFLPKEEKYSLLHEKSIEKQILQNSYYESF